MVLKIFSVNKNVFDSAEKFSLTKPLSHELFRRMFSQAQACANIILKVSSYQYQAGHYNISVKIFSLKQSIVSSVV